MGGSRWLLAVSLVACSARPVAGGDGSGSAGSDADTDAGTDSADSATSTDSTDGESEPMCGDGLLDPGEACDDGDLIDGNGCNVDCTESGRLLDSVTFELEALYGVDVGPAGSGDVWVSGYVRTPDDPYADWWVARLDDGFGVTWSATDEASEMGAALDVAFAGETLYVTGFVGGGWIDDGAARGDIWVARLDAGNGEALWSQTHGEMDDPYDLRGRGLGLALDAEGQPIVAGHDCHNPSIYYGCGWVRAHEADGTERWTDVSGPEVDEEASDVAVLPDGSLHVVGLTHPYGPDDQSGYMRRYRPDGTVEWQRTLDEPGFIMLPEEVAARTDGGTVTVGWRWPDHQPLYGALWVAVHDAAGDPVWSDAVNAGEDAALDIATDVAVDPADGSMVVTGITGWLYGSETPGVAWLRKYSAGGEVWWTRTHADPAGRDATFQAVAIDTDGTIVVVGNYGPYDSGGFTLERQGFVSRYGR